jgi:predicted ATPase
VIDKSVVSPLLVGREVDLASLDQLLAQAAKGAGHIALIAGEAGIGKSRLVTEIIQRSEKHGTQILKGNCFETDRALPYAPFTDLLSELFAAQPSRNVPPELVPLVSVTESPTSAPSADPELAKRRLFRALAEFLTPPLDSPLLIVLEDLHWCDATSLEFLLFLARRIGGHSILLLLTYRNDEASAPLTHFLAELDRTRQVTELRLDRLTLKETDSMLRAIFDLNRPIRSDFIKAVYSLTEGSLVDVIVNGAILGLLPVMLEIIGFGILLGRGLATGTLAAFLGFSVIFWGTLVGGGFVLSKGTAGI